MGTEVQKIVFVKGLGETRCRLVGIGNSREQVKEYSKAAV